MEVWNKKSYAKKNNLYMEEWLTNYREKLYFKCRQLKKDGKIKDVFTENGDIKIMISNADGEMEEKNVWSDKDLEQFEN